MMKPATTNRNATLWMSRDSWSIPAPAIDGNHSGIPVTSSTIPSTSEAQ